MAAFSNLTDRWISLSSLQKLPTVDRVSSDIRQVLIFDRTEWLLSGSAAITQQAR